MQWHNFPSLTLLLSCVDLATFVVLWWGCQHDFDRILPGSRPSSVHIPWPKLIVFSSATSPATFVFTCAFPVRVSNTHWCTLAELVITCNIRACHWRARLNQQASPMMVLFTLSATPVATELAFTQIVISLSFTHQSPLTGSDSHTPATLWVFACTPLC